jgi:hypothetical protein
VQNFRLKPGLWGKKRTGNQQPLAIAQNLVNIVLE